MPLHGSGWYGKPILILTANRGGTATTEDLYSGVEALGELTQEDLAPDPRQRDEPSWRHQLRNGRVPMVRRGELVHLRGPLRWKITPKGAARLASLLRSGDTECTRLIQKWGFDLPQILSTTQALLSQPDGDTQPNPVGPPVRRPEPPVLALDLDRLEEETLWPRERLEALITAIETDSPQLILAGPPGTSKTWVALHVAKYLVSQQPGRLFRIVQFHPSYSYEEFIEGLRPVSNNGTVTFDVVPGVVRRMVKDIGTTPGPHILLIDEINRANLPKVLGELMYLFEYRDEKIDLQYSTDFQLPPSLRFIGTMNTADRSIRSIDVALRRRFDIVECIPNRSILERYFATHANEVTNLFDGFDQLNDKLRAQLGRHHTIGHTFFMADPMTRTRLERIWHQKIYPLIEEYFFDQPDVADSFHFADFWPPA